MKVLGGGTGQRDEDGERGIRLFDESAPQTRIQRRSHYRQMRPSEADAAHAHSRLRSQGQPDKRTLGMTYGQHTLGLRNQRRPSRDEVEGRGGGGYQASTRLFMHATRDARGGGAGSLAH